MYQNLRVHVSPHTGGEHVTDWEGFRSAVRQVADHQPGGDGGMKHTSGVVVLSSDDDDALTFVVAGTSYTLLNERTQNRAGAIISGQQIADNPHLPKDTVPLNAFNIRPGVAFMLIDQPDPRVWVAEKVSRDVNFERVSVWAHDATNAAEGLDSGLAGEIALNLDYCTTVALVGVVVNEQDPDDNDWGQ